MATDARDTVQYVAQRIHCTIDFLQALGVMLQLNAPNAEHIWFIRCLQPPIGMPEKEPTREGARLQGI